MIADRTYAILMDESTETSFGYLRDFIKAFKDDLKSDPSEIISNGLKEAERLLEKDEYEDYMYACRTALISEEIVFTKLIEEE